MGKPASGWWDERAGRYFARLGEVSETTGKRRAVMLTRPDGEPVPYGDNAGVSAAIARLVAERAERHRRSQSPTVADVCRQFIAWHRANGSAPATILGHITQLNVFGNFSGTGVPYRDRPAGTIGLPELTAMRKAMEARGNVSGYVRIRYASILACWRWACRPVEDRDPARLLAVNPFDGLARPRRTRGRNRALPWPLTKRLIRRAWGMAKRHPYHRQNDRDAERVKLLRLRFIALTGCRPDEAARLRWDEVDFTQRIAVLFGKTTSRTGRMRRLPLTVSLAKALSRLSRWPCRHPEYVFLTAATRKTTRPNSHECAEWFRGLRERLIAAGFDLSPNVTLYWLRHGFGSFGVEVASVEDISGVMGNSPQVLISTYTHVENRKIREVNDAIDRARRERGKVT